MLFLHQQCVPSLPTQQQQSSTCLFWVDVRVDDVLPCRGFAERKPTELPQMQLLRSVLMTDAEGQRFNCSIPGAPSEFTSLAADLQQVMCGCSCCAGLLVCK